MRALAAVSLFLAVAAAPAEEKARSRVTFGMVQEVYIQPSSKEFVLRISTPIQPEDKVNPKLPFKVFDRLARPEKDKVELTRLGKPATAQSFNVGEPVRLTLTPDGKVKAVALMEGIKPKSKFEAHPRGIVGVRNIAFSPDGK